MWSDQQNYGGPQQQWYPPQQPWNRPQQEQQPQRQWNQQQPQGQQQQYQGGWDHQGQQLWGQQQQQVPSRTGGSHQQSLNWSEPIEVELDQPSNTDQNETKRLIAAEYNNSPFAKQNNDRISSQNIEIINTKSKGGHKSKVTFRVNDGQYPPDPQDRGILKWLIIGGIGAYIGSKIANRRRYPRHAPHHHYQGGYY